MTIKTFINRKQPVEAITPDELKAGTIVAYLTKPGEKGIAVLKQSRVENYKYGFLNLNSFLRAEEYRSGCPLAKSPKLAYASRSPEVAIETALTCGREVFSFDTASEFYSWIADNVRR